jgi:LysM repeat protein
MELKRTTLRRTVEKGNAVSQITLDDDYNVPDYRPDIVKVLKEQGRLRFDEVKAGNGTVWIKGSMDFRVLYRSEQANGKISCLQGEIPFQEKLNMDGVSEYDPVRVSGEIEDITIGVINSRKLNVRAVVLLRGVAETENEEEVTCGLTDGEDYETKIRKEDVLQLLLAKHDICRQKNEIVLPSSKPNVREILWQSVELRNVESRLADGKAGVTGEILLSVLYSEEEDGDRLQWYETTVPLDAGTECAIEESNVIHRIRAVPVSAVLEVKPDYDGEERILVLELVLDMDLKIWQEEKIELLDDLYSLKKEVHPVRTDLEAERLLVKNYAKSRLSETIELTEDQEKILQICACEGKAVIEKKELTPEGVLAEGTVAVELLYITTDDHMPVGVIREIFPFRQMVEIPEMTSQVRVELEGGMEQLAAIMLDQEHIEVKALVHLDLMAFAEITISNIASVEEEALDMEKLKERPGLTGYIAREGDALWDIAKENHTTVADIMNTNNRKEEQLAAGERILIVKQVG